MDIVARETLGLLGQVAPLPPLATAAPALFERQDKSKTDTCGFISLTDGPVPWMNIECPGGSCTTSDSFYGCGLWFHTSCHNSADPICKTGTLGPLDFCCTLEGSPFCGTASKRVDGEWLTNFECWGTLSGKLLAVDQTKTAASSEASTTEENASTSERSSQPTTISTSTVQSSNVASSGADSTSGVGSPTSAGDNAEATQSGSTDEGGSSAPVGAIVGGVLGGLALIAIIGFGLWFVRFQKRKEAKKNGDTPPYGDSFPPPDDSSINNLHAGAKYAESNYVAMSDYSSPSPSVPPKDNVPPGSHRSPPIAEAPDDNYHRVEAPAENYHRAELA
ncbi:hypothetical protein HJFPF1_07597 [Paramyrothecium foliicola]|nr:hypothetical protein HJFPF1_07597 [Paramyrothecium foliicola]